MSRRGGAALVVGVTVAVLTGCGTFGEPRAERACGKAVLADWADGRLDRSYPGPCYQAAIDALPEDLRVYSTAKDDLSRALYAHRDSP